MWVTTSARAIVDDVVAGCTEASDVSDGCMGVLLVSVEGRVEGMLGVRGAAAVATLLLASVPLGKRSGMGSVLVLRVCKPVSQPVDTWRVGEILLNVLTLIRSEVVLFGLARSDCDLFLL